MSAKHTPGLVSAGVSKFFGSDVFSVASAENTKKIIAITGFCGAPDEAESIANTERLTACWNALSDLSQDALYGGWTRAGLEAYGNQMKAQRDELLAALRYIVGCSAPMTEQQKQCWDVMRSAIAKATVEPQ
jgi:hypothetical protein